MRLDTIANDSTTNVSRNRVSFNINESSDQKGKNDQDRLANLSSNMPKKMSNTSNSKVLILRLLAIRQLLISLAILLSIYSRCGQVFSDCRWEAKNRKNL